MKLLFETPIHLPYEKVRDQFDSRLFTFISPESIPFNLKRFDGCKLGDEIHIELGPAFYKQKWVSVITQEETNLKGWSFTDEGKVLPWPLTYWKHQHRVDKISATECMIVDDIHYECSSSVLTFLMEPFLWSVFSIRPSRYQKFFKE